MDTLGLCYFSRLTKDLYIARTANHLLISRQTLNSHIMRLEKHYEVKLLNRKPSLPLIHAREYVLSFAETMSREDTNLMDILTDIQKQKRGLIPLGASALCTSASLPDILPKFSSRYPNVETRITNMNSRRLEQLILSGDLDLAIVISGDKHLSIEEKLLIPNQAHLCVADTLPRKYYGDGTEDLKRKVRNVADIKDFPRLPFYILNNRMGQSIQKCFDEAGFVPNTYTASTYVQVSTPTGLRGLAACSTTHNNTLNQRDEISKDINVFPLYCKGEPFLQQAFVIHHKSHYLSTYTQYFQKLILEYFREVEQIPVEELVNLSFISPQ